MAQHLSPPWPGTVTPSCPRGDKSSRAVLAVRRLQVFNFRNFLIYVRHVQE